MAHVPPFRRADGRSVAAPAIVQRWWLPVFLCAGVLLCAWIIAGGLLGEVLTTAMNVVWALLVLLPATMLGLLCTAGLVRRQAFFTMQFPNGYRLVLSAALGLGALSLGMLLLGSLHLLNGGVPLLLPLAASAAGYAPTRTFLRGVGWGRFRTPLTRRDLLILPACAPLALLLVACAFPAGTLWNSEGRGYDVLEYHLELPRFFSRTGSSAPVHGNIYSWLPLNTEMLYTLIACAARATAGAGYLYATVYSAQLLHAMITVLAAVAIALAPITLSAAGRAVAFLLTLGTPWTLVIGSLAYNDGAVLLYGALALGLALVATGPAAALVLGALVGLAVGTKMTAGVMVALPVAAILLGRRRWRELALVVVAAAVLYAPWAVRSMVCSHTRTSLGNPVFPIAAQTLGMDHWTTHLAQRFDRGHAAPARYSAWPTRFIALARQTVLNSQWSPGIATIHRWLAWRNGPGKPWPWPLRIGFIWLFILPAGALALARGARRVALLLLLALVVQGFCWIAFTQLQSRFMLPAILPLALLAAMACDVRRWAATALAAATGLQAALCLFLLLPQAGLLLGSAGAPPIGLLPRLPEDWVAYIPGQSNRPMNFAPDVTCYLEGYSAPLYVHGRVLYNTVFNRNLLARALRRHGPAGALRYLKKQGVNYLIVDWPEVHRLRHTYGFDPVITPKAFRAMEAFGLRPVPWPTQPGIRMYTVLPATR